MTIISTIVRYLETNWILTLGFAITTEVLSKINIIG